MAFGMLIFTAIGYTVKNINIFRRGTTTTVVASSIEEVGK